MAFALALAMPAMALAQFSLESCPGVVISHQPSPSAADILFGNDVYIADNDIVVLPNGDYIASHSYFGSGSTETTAAISKVFRSTDKGATWIFLAQFQPLWRGSLFVHGGAVYIVGPEYNGGSYSTIRKSTDNGTTWTTPADANTGKFESVPLAGTMGTPNNPLFFNNRFYAGGGTRSTFSIPATADPLIATGWRISNSASTFPTWQVGLAGPLDTAFIGEGQIVASPDLGVAVLGKVGGLPYTAVMRAERTLGDMRFGPNNDFAALPGAEKKFGAGYDDISGKFFVLSNPVLPYHAADATVTPELKRNTAAVLSSRDLMNWEVEKIFLYGPNINWEAFQYLQFAIDGDDMVVASRTAFYVGGNPPPRGHDSNLLTFHRVAGFRSLTRDHYLVADTANHQVLRYEVTPDPKDGDAPLQKFTLGSTFAGAALSLPTDLAQDANGDVYIREAAGRILRFDALGNFIAVVGSAPVAFAGSQLSIAQEASGERAWINAGSGNWADPLNWYYWGRPDTTTEVATFGSAATQPATITVDADPLTWTFDTADDEEGWTTSGITGAAVANGVFSGTSSTAAPVLNRVALAFPGSLCREVRIRLKASGPGSTVDFFWGNATADSIQTARKITVPYTEAGGFQQLVIPMAGNPAWDGQIITRMRIALPKDSGATFEVDSIELPQDSFRLKGIRFRNASAAYTIAGTGSLRIEPAAGNGLVDAQSASHTVVIPLTLTTTTDCVVAAAATLSINGVISGPGPLNKSGPGLLSLAGNNAFTGSTTIDDGTVSIASDSGLGAAPVSPTAAHLSLDGGTLASSADSTLHANRGVALGAGGGTFEVPTAATLSINGVISGPGPLIKSDSGTLTLAGANTYNGDTTITAGTLKLGAAGVIPNGSDKGNVIVTVAGIFDLNGNSETLNALSGAGIVDGASGTPTLTVGDNHQSSTFSGTIKNTAGTLSIIKTGTGTLILDGANTFAGGTAINAGELVLNGSVASAVLVNGGILNGTGSIAGDLTVSSGTHAPGASPGTMTVAGNYSLNAAATLQIDINGTAPGTQHDQVLLNGPTSTVTLAGTLSLVATPALAAGSAFVIIDNTSAEAVTGAFAGLAQNTEFYEDGQWWRISYIGGTGNDVVLTRITPTPWQTWLGLYFGANAHNPATAGDSADLDFDGMTTLLEYALGGVPHLSDPSPLPVSSVDAQRLTLTFTRTLANTDLTLTVQAADTPAGPWTDLATSIQGAAFTPLTGNVTVTETGDGPTRTVTVHDQYLLTDPAHPRRFMRLHVSR